MPCSYNLPHEILACDRSWETPNLLAVSTPRSLQLLSASDTTITPQSDLVIKQTGRVKIGTISDLAFGHQNFGRTLAASTITGSIHIYHFDRGTRAKSTLSGHNRSINAIDFAPAPAPHLLASASQDGRILVWDLRSSNIKPAHTLVGNADAVRAVQFHPQRGNYHLAAVYDSGLLQLWDLRKPLTADRRINAHTGPALTVNWHPEQDYLLTGGRDKQLQVWSTSTSSPLHVISTSGPISKARWCIGRGNNSIFNTDIALSFYNDDPTVQIWSLRRKFVPRTVYQPHSATITQLLWRTPNHLLSVSKDKSIVQCNVQQEPSFIDSLHASPFAWNPCNSIDFTFAYQSKSQFEETHETSEEDTHEPMHIYETGGKSPSSGSPPKFTQPAHLSRQPSYQKPKPVPTTTSTNSSPAWITHVHIPLLANDADRTAFLAANYLISVPPTSDIVSVCEYNSTLAAAANHFRDAKTWSTIATAFILEHELTDTTQSICPERLGTFSFSQASSYASEEAMESLEQDIPEESLPEHEKVENDLATSPRSHLTAILKASPTSTPTPTSPTLPSELPSSSLTLPWSSTELIRQACEYAASQGDTLMCATLALLFVPTLSSEDWINTYHEQLLHAGHFTASAAVRRTAAAAGLPTLRAAAQTRTLVRVKPGTKFVPCAYCREPCRGTTVTLLTCGHAGHFRCFRSWFVEENESECPRCGDPASPNSQTRKKLTRDVR